MAIRGPYDSRPDSGPPSTLAQRIRTVRLAWGWTQEDLANALNADQTLISAWERDKVTPSRAALAALAQCYGLSLEALQTGNGFEVPPAMTRPSRPARAKISVELPDAPPGTHTLIHLKEGDSRALGDAQEAILALIQATKQGQRVWVVVE